MSVLPPALHQDIVNALCYYILPFTISKYEIANRKVRLVFLPFISAKKAIAHKVLSNSHFYVKKNIIKGRAIKHFGQGWVQSFGD